MQTRNRIFDDFARLAGSAAGLAHGVGQEAQTVMRSQMERLVNELDLVPREEFDAMREVALQAQAKAAALEARVAALEAQLTGKADAGT